MSTLPLPPVEEDTSICSHLANLIQRRRGASALKTEDTRSADDIERRFVDVVRWGALDQGIKRRKVSTSLSSRASWVASCTLPSSSA